MQHESLGHPIKRCPGKLPGPTEDSYKLCVCQATGGNKLTQEIKNFVKFYFT